MTDCWREPVAVIGAGTMGLGIAQTFASAGVEVRLHDASAQARERATARALACLSVLPDLDQALSGAKLVIEAVPESLDLKLQVFERAGAGADDDAILATNTSSLSPTRIAAATDAPERVLGMHFFNPVPRMALVELIRGERTDDETLAAAERACRAIDKQTIVVRDRPGFATSRLSTLAGNEAFYMLMEGVASAEDIDKAARLGANHPLGPLELADLVGLDVRLDILRHMHRSWGEKFRPCPLLVTLVDAGRLGRKTGHGVYRYGDDGTRL